MRTKLGDIREAVALCSYSIIILVETWLSEDFSEAEISYPGYNVFRTDRNSKTSAKVRGGGVLIACAKKYKATRISITSDIVEQLFVQFRFDRKSFIVGGVYLPPNCNIDKYRAHCSTVEEVCQGHPSCMLAIFGDYNLPGVQWYNGEDGVSVQCSEASPAGLVAETFAYCNLYQSIDHPNSRNIYLDLVFANYSECETMPAIDLLTGNSVHHIAYTFSLGVKPLSSLEYEEFYYDFRNVDYVAVNNFCAEIDWECLYQCENVNKMAEWFYQALHRCFDKFVPRKRVKSSNFPKWFSPDLKEMTMRKKIAHRNYLIHRTAYLYDEFSALRAQCKALSADCYRQYISKVEVNLRENPRMFWKFVNEKRKCNGVPGSVYLGAVRAHNGPDMVRLFSQHFASVYSEDDCPVPEFRVARAGDVLIGPLELSAILDKIDQVPDRASVGPDQIPMSFYKKCVFTLARPLYILFNSSIKQGTFPDAWKQSFIVPILKSGDPEDVKNYRGVCNQNTVAKLLDSLVNDQLQWACKGIVSEAQHGFCAGRSTTTNLVEYGVALLDALERGEQVDSVYTDFSKAFDRVNFDLLLSKLRATGFGRGAVCWLESFLRGRTQCVKINGYISDSFVVHSGVPQGSHCAPLLFNIFINDISDFVKHASTSFYADDLKLYMKVESVTHSMSLQADIDALWEWCRINHLELNIKKCQFISFHRSVSRIPTSYRINGVRLDYSSIVKDLGVYFDERVTFHDHVVRLTQRNLKMLGFVCRNSNDLSVDVLKTLYVSLVRSSLEYASVVWSPFYRAYVDIIERVQNRFLRAASFKMGINSREYHRGYILQRLNLPTLEERRRLLDVCFVYKMLMGMYDCGGLLARVGFNVPSRSLRNGNMFYINFHRTSYGTNSPIDRALRTINDMDEHGQMDIFNLSLAGFRGASLRFLADR